MILKRVTKRILSKFGYRLIPIGDSENDAYYCRVLTGMSDYNLSINSDLSVSCSCNDPSGEAVIGHLNGKNKLKDIFFGEKANAMRKDLANGKLPIITCSVCQELCPAPRSVAAYYENNSEIPTGGIMVENCSLCNFNCIYCSRKEIIKSRTSNIISLENITYIANEIKNNNIKKISFFKLGDPFFDKEITKKLRIIKNIIPEIEISTSTNGVLIDNADKVDAALQFDRIHFSIDGINTEMQNKYQRGADFDKIMDNIRMIVKERGDIKTPVLVWKYVVFSWNDRAEYIYEAFKKAKEIGFDRILFVKGKVAQYVNSRSKRFYMNDFIPADNNYKLISFFPDGMEFDLHSKTSK